MPLTMKVQPIDSTTADECLESVKTVPKSRLKRLFDFSSFLRGSTVADRSVTGEPHYKDGCSDEFEPSSVCLDKMVQNFIEDNNSNEKYTVAADGSEDDSDSFNCFGNSNNHTSSTDACDPLRSLVLCETVCERNLLADVAKIVDKNKICKRKDEASLKIVVDGLLATGYTVSVCKSRWEKTSTYPAGEYEYIDAVIEDDRLIIDIDFRSEFEIARSTKSYKAILQMLPHIFVGRTDRLQKIINIVSDAAKLSLKKKGMPLPPWRRADYVKAKWLTPCNRTVNNVNDNNNPQSFNDVTIKVNPISDPKDAILIDETAEQERLDEAVKHFEPLEIKPKVPKSGGKVISGLASVIEGK